MADKYLGSFANSNEFKIQELIRVLDATLGEVNSAGLQTGQNCLSIIKFLSSFEGFKNFVSPDYAEHIEQEVQKSEGKQNVREHVKKVLMYPRTGYLPWVEFETAPQVIEEIREEADEVKFKLQVVEGKVYGVCTSEKKLNELVFDKVKEQLPALRLNFETCHITIVNSNIVADIGQENVERFIQDFNHEFTVTTGKIKSTFSEDWSRFGECYVIELECPYVDEFLTKFNEKFKKNVKITKHTTFAIQPRSLW